MRMSHEIFNMEWSNRDSIYLHTRDGVLYSAFAGSAERLLSLVGGLRPCRSNREHLQEYVDDIDVFIFDVGNGALVEKHHLEGEQLLSPLEVRLPEGDYKVVAVGNALNETVIGDGAYGEASVSRPELAEKDGPAAGTFDRLYLGETTITSKVMNDSRDVVRLYSQHVKIHAVVLPDDDENAGTWYEQNKGTGFRLTMETLSARFSFSGQRSGETSFDLPFYTGGKNDRFVLDFNTLRFKDGDPLTIRLMQGDKVLCMVDVAEYIALYPDQIRITGRQEAVLPLFFRQNPRSLTVSVKPWEAVDVVPITD